MIIKEEGLEAFADPAYEDSVQNTDEDPDFQVDSISILMSLYLKEL